jgi:hypothetical protein
VKISSSKTEMKIKDVSFRKYLSIIRLRYSILVLLIIVFLSEVYPQAYEGYTLFSPNNSRYSYLVDMNNNVVHTWSHTTTGGYSCYLLPDGSLIRSAVSGTSLNGGGATGMLQRVSWSGTLLWQYTYSSSTYRLHHDFEVMPNGNILMIAWEVKTAAQSVSAGLNHSATLWPDHIIEVQPVGTNGGNIVWKWHFWDHLIQDYDASKSNFGVVANHPELLDINVGSTSGDWMHVNGVSYNPETDQIVFSSHNLNELYVIDHSTTIAEAAGHIGGNMGKGGDILYRWGKPANYRASGSQIFKVVHNSVWIPDGLPGAGNIMAFNNREGQGTSMVVEIVPPKDEAGNYILNTGAPYGPADPIWSYTATGFYSNHLGGNQRLPNGNTLIAESTSGYLFEVNQDGNTVWSYNRGGQIVRAQRYPYSYSGVSALPVELSSFNANIIDGKIELSWITNSETNNSGFEIYRSQDAIQFDKIGFISGRGTDTDINSYSFLDAPISNGKYYYKLRQIDFDGNFEYSNLVEVEFYNEMDFALLQNYPNPFNPNTTIEFILPVAEIVLLKIYNLLGSEVETLLSEYREAGRHSITFNASNLSSGVYLYRLSSGNSVQSKQMILVK